MGIKYITNILFLFIVVANGFCTPHKQILSDIESVVLNGDKKGIAKVEKYVKNREIERPFLAAISCGVIWDKWHYIPILENGLPSIIAAIEEDPDNLYLQILYVRWLRSRFVICGAEETLSEFRSYFEFCKTNNISPMIYEDSVWNMDSLAYTLINEPNYRDYQRTLTRIKSKYWSRQYDDKKIINTMREGIQSGERLCMITMVFAAQMGLLEINQDEYNLIISSLWPTYDDSIPSDIHVDIQASYINALILDK